jgi:hypothetical protein
VSDLAIFEFTPAERERPFIVDLAEGWTSMDKGHWVMYIPPNFPVGMDIYEMGTYSSDEDGSEQDCFNQVRSDVALEWARRVNENAAQTDLKPAKVGAFDALYYESLIPSQLQREVRWRQWVFMDGGQCYFIVSTILPELDERIYPDVKKMLASFRTKAGSRAAPDSN